MLFKLLIGHAFSDFVFQSDSIGRGKNRNYKTEPPPGQKFIPCWPYYLAGHALVNGGLVFMITGNPLLALGETIAHGCIDFGKCENWYGPYGVHIDQSLHFLCKVLWAYLWTVMR